MWRHSRWYESDWMIHTVIESAQENSHISAWECSHTAVRETDCGYWGGCWWDEAHPSSNKTFWKEIKNDSCVIIYSPSCRYKTVGFSSFYRTKNGIFWRISMQVFSTGFIFTRTENKNTTKDHKSSLYDLCIIFQAVNLRTAATELLRISRTGSI